VSKCRGLILLVVACALAGCGRMVVGITDPDGHLATIYSTQAMLAMLTFFIPPLLMLLLFVAALLHWRRTRHWCLLALAIAPFLVGIGNVAGHVAQLPLRGHTIREMGSGSVRVSQSLMTVSQVLICCGLLVAAVGGIGAIIWALKRPPAKVPRAGG
jgi:hypothetical protein